MAECRPVNSSITIVHCMIVENNSGNAVQNKANGYEDEGIYAVGDVHKLRRQTFELDAKSSGGSNEVTLGCRTGPKSCGEISMRFIAIKDLGSLTLFSN
jgi:hypothetical protein